MSKKLTISTLIAFVVCTAISASALRTGGVSRGDATMSLSKDSFVDWLCHGTEEKQAMCRSRVGVESFRKTATRVVDRIVGVDGGISGLEGALATIAEQSAPLKSFMAARRGKALLHGLWSRMKAAVGVSKREQAISYLNSLREDLAAHAKAHGIAADSDFLPFEFLPQYIGGLDAATSQQNQSFSTKCFPTFTVSTSFDATTHMLTATMNVPAGAFAGCSSQFMLAPGNSDVALHIFEGKAVAQTKTVSFDLSKVYASADPAEVWYFQTRGLKLYELQTGNVIASVLSVIDTVVLLVGFAIKAPSGVVFDASYEFVRNFVQADPTRMGPKTTIRTAGNVVARNLDPSNINSGDLIMLLRPDGLDPMIGWGEGSMAGHSTVAVRIPNKGLHVCESTTTDAYWPNNGIQCTPWAEWLQLCEDSIQNVVHVPMKPEYLAKFNTTAALAFFEAHKAVDYGYQTFLFGWLDTATGNLPCTPHSNYTICLGAELVEKIALFLDSLFESNHENFFRQALAHRVGLWNPTNTPSVIDSIYHGATAQNKNFVDLYQMPEQDSYLYNTTQAGASVVSKSMVCCVFVCNMWKAAGIFSEIGNQLQCGEQTLWDIYSMALFDSSKMGEGRPQVCKDADPTNPLCQLMGNMTMVLVPDVNTRPLYPNMGEKCAATCPAYNRPAGC